MASSAIEEVQDGFYLLIFFFLSSNSKTTNELDRLHLSYIWIFLPCLWLSAPRPFVPTEDVNPKNGSQLYIFILKKRVLNNFLKQQGAVVVSKHYSNRNNVHLFRTIFSHIWYFCDYLEQQDSVGGIDSL